MLKINCFRHTKTLPISCIFFLWILNTLPYRALYNVRIFIPRRCHVLWNLLGLQPALTKSETRIIYPCITRHSYRVIRIVGISVDRFIMIVSIKTFYRSSRKIFDKSFSYFIMFLEYSKPNRPTSIALS